MNGLTTVTTKGQVTIPEFVRRSLGVKVGDKVHFGKIYNNKRQILIKIVSKDAVDKLFGALKLENKTTNLNVVRKESIKKLADKYGLR